MKYLTEEEQDKFFSFLRGKLRVSKATYARVIKRSPITVYWQIKEGKVRREQVEKFKEIYFKDLEL